MKKILALLLTGLMVLSAISAVWAQAEPSGAELPKNRIKYDSDELNVAGITPTTGNFFSSVWGNVTSDMDVRLLLHGYNLVDWNGEEGVFTLNGAVVSGIVVTEDPAGNRTYTLALHDDLYYSDGTPITAWDYAFSTLLTMSPEAAEIGGNVKRPQYILGYEDYINGSVPCLAGFRVLADDMLSVTVSADYLPFFYELALLDCTPYPISEIAPGVRVADDGNGIYLTNADGGSEPAFTADLLRRTILDPETGYMTHPTVTSGPYRLVSYEDGIAEFEINAYYKSDAKGYRPTIQRLTYRSLQGQDLVEAFESGEIGLLNKVTMSEQISSGLEAVAENPDQLTSVSYLRTGLAFLSFAAERPAVNDPAVRQAIAYQIDKDSFIEETVGNYGQRTDGFYGLGQWMYRLLSGAIAFPAETAGDQAAWDELSLDSIPVYEHDPETAAALLDQAGWNLNAEGAPYDSASDSVRFKQTEAGLEPLRLSLGYPESTAAADALEELAESLSDAGFEITAAALPLEEILPQYYGMAERQYDMYFLSSNFDVLFDPSSYFVMNEDGEPVWQSAGLADRELYDAAVAMRQTKPGDLVSYCRHWLEFQKRFSEVLPMIPLYSNVYYDFFPRALHDYDISTNLTWSMAVIPACMDGDMEDLPEG